MGYSAQKANSKIKIRSISNWSFLIFQMNNLITVGRPILYFNIIQVIVGMFYYGRNLPLPDNNWTY
jgi:hypothetical protein